MFVDGWMPIPQAIPLNCPNGLQYLSTINQLLVKQKVEILEGNWINFNHPSSIYCSINMTK